MRLQKLISFLPLPLTRLQLPFKGLKRKPLITGLDHAFQSLTSLNPGCMFVIECEFPTLPFAQSISVKKRLEGSVCPFLSQHLLHFGPHLQLSCKPQTRFMDSWSALAHALGQMLRGTQSLSIGLVHDCTFSQHALSKCVLRRHLFSKMLV